MSTKLFKHYKIGKLNLSKNIISQVPIFEHFN